MTRYKRNERRGYQRPKGLRRSFLFLYLNFFPSSVIRHQPYDPAMFLLVVAVASKLLTQVVVVSGLRTRNS